MFLALVICVTCQVMSGDSQAISHLQIATHGLPIRCQAEFSCGAPQFPKHHLLILKTDYTAVMFPKKRMKHQVSNGLK